MIPERLRETHGEPRKKMLVRVEAKLIPRPSSVTYPLDLGRGGLELSLEKHHQCGLGKIRQQLRWKRRGIDWKPNTFSLETLSGNAGTMATGGLLGSNFRSVVFDHIYLSPKSAVCIRKQCVRSIPLRGLMLGAGKIIDSWNAHCHLALDGYILRPQASTHGLPTGSLKRDPAQVCSATVRNSVEQSQYGDETQTLEPYHQRMAPADSRS